MKILFRSLTGLILLSSIEQALAQSDTPKNVTAVTSINAALIGASGPALAELRTNERIISFRTILTRQILKGDLSIPFADVIRFICDNRETYWKLRGQTSVLQSVDENLAALYKDPPKNEDTTIIGRLSYLYTTIKTYLGSRDQNLPQVKQDRRYDDVCSEDIKTFDEISHPSPATIAVVGPSDIVAGINVVLDVVEPPIYQAIKIGRSVQRQKAVFKFFNDQKNRDALIDAATQLSNAVTDQNTRQRRGSMGQVVEQWAIIAKNRNLKDFKDCDDFNSLNATQRLGEAPFNFQPSFYRCFAAVFSEYDKPFQSALQAASSYDTGADIAVLANGAKDSLTSLKSAISSIRSPQNGDDFVRNLSDLLQLAIAVEKAASKQSQDSIAAAVKKLINN